MGNVGIFIAHSLVGIPNPPPLTLLFKGYEQLWRWQDVEGTLKLTTHGTTEARKGFDIEVRRGGYQEVPLEETQSDSRVRTAAREFRDPQHSTPELMFSSRNGATPRNAFFEEQAFASKRDNSKAQDALSEVLEASQADKGHQDGSIQEVEAQIQANNSRSQLTECGIDGSQRKQLENEYENGSVGDQNGIIYHLIVATKASGTAKAVQSWAHRLAHESTILFLQNGMGVIEEVNEQVFPDPKTRPQYMVGVNSHGLKSSGSFEAVHTGEGTIALGIMPQLDTPGSQVVQSLSQAPASARYLLRTMTRTPVFIAVGFPPTDLLQQQLDKLAVNAIINPLTAMLDCQNGGIIYSFNLTRVMRLLLAEISLVIRSMPELRDVPNVSMRFDTLRLERLVVSIAEATSNNDSSMLQDIRACRRTEIDYINGYIIKRGEELGLHCVLNYMLMHMVKAKGTLLSRNENGVLPFPGIVKKPKT
ncbi:MAG: hypothetical protein Q9163_004664 [Psora crenata]